MKIYGVTNLIVDDYYNTIQQLSTDPNKLDWYVQGYIVWYRDWNIDEPLNTMYADIADIQENWKIWECSSRIFDCSYHNDTIYQNGNGVLGITYKEGKLIRLKYWNNKKDYLKGNNPEILKTND